MVTNRILGVVGSPRKKGNTHILVDTILDGAAKEGAATELLFLSGFDIRECNGCHVCWKKGKCAKKDDMNGLYPKVIESNVIIFGTPVYWYGPTALMKGFIDRFVYFNCDKNRAGVKGKRGVIAVPFEDDDPETAAGLVTFFQKSFTYLEMNLAGQILVPGVTRKGEIAKKKDCLSEAFQLGKSLVTGCP